MTATPSTARERVHAMESLAAVIAHELRAGVLSITSAAQLLRFSVPQDPVAEKSLGRILQESERLSAIHDALTEYATELPPCLEAADPDAIWTDVIRRMRGALEAKSVILTHSAKPSNARLDPDQMGRAFGRVVQHTLTRVTTGASVDIVSSVEDGWWACAVAAREPAQLTRADAARSSISLVLAERTLVAHGGEVIDHGTDEAPLLLTIRLPLSLQPE